MGILKNITKATALVRGHGVRRRVNRVAHRSLTKLGLPGWNPIFPREAEELIPPRELWVNRNDTIMHFLRWPHEYRILLTLLCGLREDSSVLELGCSHGRTMLGLLGYLRPPGRYEGFDILPKQIEFARKRIQARYPHCHFSVADVYNGLYNPTGCFKAENYTFPYADGSFDVAYAASVFTHLLPPDATHYFRESRRVLRPGGHCLFSFFLLDNYGGPGTPIWELYQFDSALAGHHDVAVHDASRPEQVTAYRTRLVERMASDAGFRVNRVLPGYWSNTQKLSVNEQDLVLLDAV